MIWLAPGFLVAGAAAAVAAVALHLIMHRLPPVASFPTARFIPPGSARAVRRAMRPDDIPLLALRVAMLLLLAAALARPVLTPERRERARVVVLDRSRSIADMAEARDSARSVLEAGDLLVAVDSAARVVPAEADSLARLERLEVRASLSAGIIAATQAAPGLADRADSVEMVIISALQREELDAATMSVRAEWPGRIRLVRLTPDTGAAVGTEGGQVAISSPANDPVAAAVALHGSIPGRPAVRIVRSPPTPDDSTWARRGGTLVHWPAAGEGRAGAPAAQVTRDSIGAVVAEGAVVVAAFGRSAGPGEPTDSGTATPVAWWADGRPAAVERPMGAGCARDVRIDVPARGDLVLRASFAGLLHALTAPCGGVRDRRPASDELLAQLSGTGTLASMRALPTPARRSALAPWLLAGALLLALVEPLVRRRREDE